MTLNPTQLGSDFAGVFSSFPASPRDCADALADAFHAYCSAAVFGASTPQIPSANRDAFADAIYAAIANPAAGLPAVISAAFAAATAAYWLAVPVVGAQSGVTVGCPGAASLPATLAVIFANLANTPTSAGASIALALHAAVMTVTASVAPPPGTVLPIA